jgi:hypothetical protein
MQNSLHFTCVHATAVSCCGTQCGYGETVNRSGVTAVDIGLAAMKAFTRLAELSKGEEEFGDILLIRFSSST